MLVIKLRWLLFSFRKFFFSILIEKNPDVYLSAMEACEHEYFDYTY